MKIVVIGGGYAGLSAGALLAHTGHKVHLYEAHTYVGGCASFFKRKDFKFDAGATTLSGLGPGRPLNRLIEILNLDFPISPLKSPMKITLNDGRTFIRHKDLKEHIATMEIVFPGLPHDKFWNDLKEKEESLWSILSAGQYFPPKGLKDLKRLLDPKVLKNASLGLLAFIPFIKTIPKEMRADDSFMSFINEQLLISTQSHANQVPALLAAMGLIYPDDMYYSEGGMVALGELFAQKIKDSGGEVFLRRPVTKVSKESNGKFSFKVRGPGGKEIYDEADVVISNLTVWDTPKILDKKLSEIYPQHQKRAAWGALSAYFAVKIKEGIKPLYHQVHFNSSFLGVGSFFISFSHPNDKSRAPEGYQTVTVSTHTRSEDWDRYYNEGIYDQNIELFKEEVKRALSKIIPPQDIQEMTEIEVGTPHTFERFTGRHKGLVGGLPHNLKNNILTFPSQETAIKGLYQIGDTTFPGQGVVGVVTGAMMLAGKINDTNYLK